MITIAKTKTDPQVVEIQKNLDKMILGTKRSIEELRKGKVARVYLSSNCPAEVVEDIRRYAEMSDTPVTELNYSNEQIGLLCKKPYMISVLSLRKDG